MACGLWPVACGLWPVALWPSEPAEGRRNAQAKQGGYVQLRVHDGTNVMKFIECDGNVDKSWRRIREEPEVPVGEILREG